MRRHPRGERIAAQTAGRNPQDDVVLLIDRSLKVMPIEHKEQLHGRMSNALVAVYKRVILYEREAQSGGFGGQRWADTGQRLAA